MIYSLNIKLKLKIVYLPSQSADETLFVTKPKKQRNSTKKKSYTKILTWCLLKHVEQSQIIPNCLIWQR